MELPPEDGRKSAWRHLRSGSLYQASMELPPEDGRKLDSLDVLSGYYVGFNGATARRR